LLNFSFRHPYLRYPLYNFIPIAGQVWKYNSTIDKWTRVVGGYGKDNNSAGFGDRQNQYLWSFEVFNDQIYCGTMHPDPTTIKLTRDKLFNWKISFPLQSGRGEIWRSSDGKNWEPVVDDGFNDRYNVGIREMKVYNNSLIAATFNINTRCEVWKLNGS